MADEQQVNVPSLLVILVLSGLIIRYLFFSPPPSSSAGGQPGQQGANRGSTRAQRNAEAQLLAREVAVERILQMFPQTDRRTVLWDLQRNGGNVVVTTERILAGQLQTPPVTFQPPPPPGASATATGGATVTPVNASKPAEKPEQPDLITRYNLKDKLASPQPAEEQEAVPKGKAWSSNKEERQSLLQKRRDQMILEARRKMEAKIAAEKAAAEAAGGSA